MTSKKDFSIFAFVFGLCIGVLIASYYPTIHPPLPNKNDTIAFFCKERLADCQLENADLHDEVWVLRQGTSDCSYQLSECWDDVNNMTILFDEWVQNITTIKEVGGE